MRSRERLLEVIDTLGEAANPVAIIVLAIAADIINGDGTAAQAIQHAVHHVARCHSSPHIRELAAEVLHYLDEGQP